MSKLPLYVQVLWVAFVLLLVGKEASGQVLPSEATPTAAKPAEEDDVSPLVPDWERERVQDHTVAATKGKFKPGKGLTFATADGDFSLSTKVRGQVLYTLEHPNVDGQDTEEGLSIRRARVGLAGNFWGKHNKFKMELAVSPRDQAMTSSAVGTTSLLDWVLTFDQVPALTLVAGQYKVPYNRQRVVSSGALQFVDRSIVQAEFNLDRDIAVDVRSSKALGGLFRYYACVGIGEGRNSFANHKVGHMYLGRVEVLPFGEFDDYVESDFSRALKPRLSLGAAYARIHDAKNNRGILGSNPADKGTTDFDNVEADLIFKYAGASVMGEVFWRQGERFAGAAVDKDGKPVATQAPRNGWGFFAQAAYLLPRTAFEIGARYGQIRPEDDTSTLSEANEVGAEVSYYFAHHAFKLQADYFRLWGEDGLGDGTDQVRVQLEAGF